MHSVTENNFTYDSEKRHGLPLLFALFGISMQSQMEMESHPLLILLASLMTKEIRYLK